MGLFDRFRDAPPPAPTATDVVARSAAIAPVVATDGSSLTPLPSRKIPQDPRQVKARFHAKHIGFVGTTYEFIAHQAARPPLVVERSLDGIDWEVVPWLNEDGTPHEDGDPAAWEALNYIKSPAGSASELVNNGVYLDDTVGEFNLIDVTGIWPGLEEGQPAFIVRDTAVCKPVKGKKGITLVEELPGGRVKDGTAFEIQSKRVYRHWQPDRDHYLKATSSLMNLVDDCDTYWTLQRRFRRTVRSRLAMNDLFWIPTEAHAIEVEVNGKMVSKFDYAWSQAATRNLLDTDDENVASIAPLAINSPGAMPVPQVISMPGIGPEMLSYLSDARQLVASSLPLSSSAIFDDGGSSGNHWSDWLADEKDLQIISERLDRVLDSFTRAVFRPILVSAEKHGVWTPPEGYTAAQYRIGSDTDVIRRSLDNGSNMQWLWTQGLVTDEAVRRELHAKETDAPDEEEWTETLAHRKALVEAITPAAAPAPGGGPPPPEQPELDPAATKELPAAGTPGDIPETGPVPNAGEAPTPQNKTAGAAVLDDLWLLDTALSDA